MQSGINYLKQNKPGLNYLVPTDWFQDFIELNQNIHSVENLKLPSLKFQDKIDNFVLDYKEQIVSEMENKNNNLKFNKVIISPESLQTAKWSIISPSLWKIVKLKQNALPIFTYFSKLNQQLFPTKQIQVIFKSQFYSIAFVGYIKENALFIDFIRALGFQLGFIQMCESKIQFPEKNNGHYYNFFDLEGITIKNIMDTFITITNLERVQQEQQQKNKKRMRDFMNDSMGSNQAVAGDVLTMIDQSQPQQNKKQSQVSSLQQIFNQNYSFEKQDKLTSIFKNKSTKDVQEMEKYAIQRINGVMISIPKISYEQMCQQLQAIAQEILNGSQNTKRQKTEDEN